MTKNRRWWVEFPLLFVLYEGFEVLRNHLVGGAGPAQTHARWIVDLERWTWTLHEHRFNSAVVQHKTVAQAMDIYYGTIHFVVPVVVLVWLWRRRPDQYTRWRNILAAATVVSLVFFSQFPLAPPRLYTGGGAPFVDTATRFGGLGPFDRGNFKDKNPYAAMPSLHVAWSTWCACGVIAASKRRRARWLALLYPAVTLAVVIGTANHWFLDGVGGWILLAAGWAGVSWWMNRPSHGKEDLAAQAV